MRSARTSARDEISVADHVKMLPASVRPIVHSARRTVKTVSPRAKEIAYQSRPPRSSRSMYKIIRYTLDDAYVAAIGTFPTYATIFFPRGRELDNVSGLLEGSGKDFRFIRLQSPSDAQRPAVKRVVREAFELGGSRRGD